jgi:hypothetical protein
MPDKLIEQSLQSDSVLCYWVTYRREVTFLI